MVYIKSAAAQSCDTGTASVHPDLKGAPVRKSFTCIGMSIS